jgi:hypothetical protein
MTISGRIAGAVLVLVGGYVLLNATLEILVGKFGLPIWTYAPYLIVWFLLFMASLQTMSLGWTLIKGNMSGLSLWPQGDSLISVTVGIVIIVMLLAGPFVDANEGSFTLEYLASVYMPRLVAGISSVIHGVRLWRWCHPQKHHSSG